MLMVIGAHVVAQSDRAQELCAANSKLLASRQRSGNGGDTGMRARRAMRIVGFVGMRQHAIRQCGLDWTAHDLCGDYGRDFLAAVSAGELDGGTPGGKSEPEIMAANVSRM